MDAAADEEPGAGPRGKARTDDAGVIPVGPLGNGPCIAAGGGGAHDRHRLETRDNPLDG